MSEPENKTQAFPFSNFNDVDSCLSEVKKLQEQLERERKAAEQREKVMTQSLQESKQMSTHLQQISQALTKERKAFMETY